MQETTVDPSRQPMNRTPQDEGRGSPPRAILRTRMAAALPALLLGAFAAASILGHLRGGPAAPDKGGAFGMFSTVDRLANRQLRAEVEDAAGRLHALPLEPGLESDPRVRLALARPGEATLRPVASVLAQTLGAAGSPAVRVRVVVTRAAFDAESNLVTRLPLHAVSEAVPAFGGR